MDLLLTPEARLINTTSQPDTTPEVLEATDPTPKSLTADRLQALLQMQKTDSFCKIKSKYLSNGKAPQHETELFTHVRGLVYECITDSSQKFLTFIISKSWKYIVLCWSPWQIRPLRNNLHLLSYQMPLLLEGYE